MLQQENLKLASRTTLPADPPKPAVARQKPTSASGRPCTLFIIHLTFHAVHVPHGTQEAAIHAGKLHRRMGCACTVMSYSPDLDLTMH